MLKDILIFKGADFSTANSPKNPLGLGHMLHKGFAIRCQGHLAPNPDYDPADENSPKEIVVDQHLIGTITEVPPDGRAALPQDCVVPTERADEATFTLDPDQAGLDPKNPVCQACGQPIERIA